MDYELPFIVMVDSPGDAESLVAFLHAQFSDARPTTQYSLEYHDEWIEVRPNDMADDVLRANPDDGYQYYPFRVEVSPIRTVDISEQVQFAKRLDTLLNMRPYRAVVVADFEELL